ncbi:Putative 4-hydroxy-2-oxoglutarate aldolase, mitochondrial [Talaromyces islandicus]|uniref:Putative 4-hydroxy-2-oxoglutarate aldolase, mitochondrial n=1 Tax=Talaromyces islandicus TaxID=28573 RepID=A0A0U1LT42_TALIS|nr:Putative 4-hydroxy-2-oxoglutarate aldolase, mitochondrial [Talaromyces islandicus]
MTSTIAIKSKQLPPGVYVPVISPYKSTARQEIDLDAAYKHFTHLIRGGVHGIVLAGTNAEAVLLSPTERQELVRVARKAAQDLGVADYPLVAGISGQSTNESIRLAEDAAKAGAGWALLLPPSYWAKAVSKDVILSFYKEVADLSPIPVVIYSFPGVTNGVDISSDVMSELAHHPNIVGTKLTCGNAGKVTRLSHQYSPKQFSVYAGSSDWLLPCLIGGGVGCVTGMGNVFPKSTSKLYNLWAAGKTEEAQKLQGLVAETEKVCKEGIALTKYAAWYFIGRELGIAAEVYYPRKPYQPVGKEKQDWAVKVMTELSQYENSLPDVVGK